MFPFPLEMFYKSEKQREGKVSVRWRWSQVKCSRAVRRVGPEERASRFGNRYRWSFGENGFSEEGVGQRNTRIITKGELEVRIFFWEILRCMKEGKDFGFAFKCRKGLSMVIGKVWGGGKSCDWEQAWKRTALACLSKASGLMRSSGGEKALEDCSLNDLSSIQVVRSLSRTEWSKCHQAGHQSG